jgi:ABC-type branched-subunit amino acid transport system ATPase component
MTAAPAPALLAVANVSQDFDGVRAVDDVSFALPRDVIYGLIGPNGAGKSTLLNIVAGARRPATGSIEFDGRDVTRLADYRRARLGLIRTFQRTGEFPHLTVLENLLAAQRDLPGEHLRELVWRRRRQWEAAEASGVDRARELLDEFGILEWQDEYAGNLSGGQRRIVELLRAVMARPVVLLLDEPVAGVHPEVIERICRHLEALRDEGVTILMVEHTLNVVERLCDQTIVMAAGRIIFTGAVSVARRQQEVVDAYIGA